MADQFEQEFMPTKPLTKSMRVQERRAKRGRPVVGEGATKVLVSLERGLLRAADSYAMESGKNRSQVIADGLRAILPVRALRSAG